MKIETGRISCQEKMKLEFPCQCGGDGCKTILAIEEIGDFVRFKIEDEGTEMCVYLKIKEIK